MTSKTTNEHKIRQGDAYEVNVSKNVSGGGSLNLHVENPSSSGSRIVITSVRVSTTGPFDVERPRAFTVDSTGTEQTVYNRAIGASNGSDSTVYQDTSFSSADDTMTEHLANSAGPAVGDTDEDVQGAILEDEDYIIQLSNRDASTPHDASITIRFFETSARNVGE